MLSEFKEVLQFIIFIGSLMRGVCLEVKIKLTIVVILIQNYISVLQNNWLEIVILQDILSGAKWLRMLL